MLIDQYDILNGEIFQAIDDNGKVVNKKEFPNLKDQEIRNLYENMLLTRALDQKMLSLQRQGRLYTFAPSFGQEAAQIGSAAALTKRDWIFPSFREWGVMIAVGIPLKNILVYNMGDEHGNQSPQGINFLPISIPVGTHLLHAVGAAWASKLKKDNIITIAYFGDGGTSEGDFHEAMNFAGVYKTPTIFFCQNNQYAISLPREKQTASGTLAQKAFAYGFKGIQVDGNDVFAVYALMKEAVEYARKGNPIMIEAVTYRLGQHKTSDDTTLFRSNEEVEKWKKKDPVKRMQLYMKDNNLWNQDYENEIQSAIKEKVDNAVKEAEAFPKQKPEEFFDYVFKEKTQNLKEQQEYLKRFYK